MRKATRSANIENLTGSNFDDTLEGNAGNNKLVGGLGTDTVSYANATSGANGVGVTVNLSLTSTQNTIAAGTDTLSGFENLTGSQFNDTLTGTTAANVLTGLGGNDMLNGGVGADWMLGGTGNDTYVVDNVGDVVTETRWRGHRYDPVVDELSSLCHAGLRGEPDADRDGGSQRDGQCTRQHHYRQ